VEGDLEEFRHRDNLDANKLFCNLEDFSLVPADSGNPKKNACVDITFSTKAYKVQQETRTTFLSLLPISTSIQKFPESLTKFVYQ